MKLKVIIDSLKTINVPPTLKTKYENAFRDIQSEYLDHVSTTHIKIADGKVYIFIEYEGI